MSHNKSTLEDKGLMIDNHLYIPTTRLHKEKSKRKRSEYKVYPFND